MDDGNGPGIPVREICAEDLAQAAKVAGTWYWLRRSIGFAANGN